MISLRLLPTSFFHPPNNLLVPSALQTTEPQAGPSRFRFYDPVLCQVHLAVFDLKINDLKLSLKPPRKSKQTDLSSNVQSKMLTQFIILVCLAWLAGITMPLGALLARATGHFPAKERRQLFHFSASLGAGALVSAVTLVLVPHGVKFFNPLEVFVVFFSGAIAFLLLDRTIASKGSHRGQLLAMLLDFVPESIALGATIATSFGAATLLIILIALQNLPEGFNAYHECTKTQHGNKNPIRLFFAFSLLGPAAAIFGMLVLSEHATILASMMLFAGGGILYLTFQDVAPEARYRGHWAPPLGAIIGFLVGLLGQMLLKAEHSM